MSGSREVVAASMWRDGNPVHKIAKELGCTRSNVYCLLKKAGVKMRPPTPPRPDVSAEVIQVLHEKGLSSEDIAKALKCSPLLVSKRLRKAGLKANGRTYSRPSETEVKLFHSRGMCDARIASTIGFSRSVVCKVRAQLGLKPNRQRPDGSKRVKNGYIEIHRGANDNVYEHRTVAESKLGRSLQPGEVVHHMDRNRRNNSPDNLAVFPNNGKHMSHHCRLKKEHIKDCAEECLKSGAIVA